MGGDGTIYSRADDHVTEGYGGRMSPCAGKEEKGHGCGCLPEWSRDIR